MTGQAESGHESGCSCPFGYYGDIDNKEEIHLLIFSLIPQYVLSYCPALQVSEKLTVSWPGGPADLYPGEGNPELCLQTERL